MDLARSTRFYTIYNRPMNQDELNWFKNRNSVEEAIILAAKAQDAKGNRLIHHRRIRKGTLEEARQALLPAVDDLRECKSFDDLLTLVESKLNPIGGLGDLYAYDVALRVGAKIDLRPEKVYLHTGSRLGAEALGLNPQARALEIQELPDELQELEPLEMEDFLAIYRSSLKKPMQDKAAGKHMAAS